MPKARSRSIGGAAGDRGGGAEGPTVSTSTRIEWATKTWSPIIGCSRKSRGCDRCYAETFVHRGLRPEHRGLTVLRQSGVGWTGEVRFLPERLTDPQRWRKPQRIFVNSLSDVFHEHLSHEKRLALLGAMVMAPQHVHMILTKRPEVAVAFERWLIAEGERRRMTFREMALAAYAEAVGDRRDVRQLDASLPTHGHAWWIGVTAEDQEQADKRIPLLLSLRLLPTLYFVSYEPALGPIEWRSGWMDAPESERSLGWVIAGSESGARRRQAEWSWFQETRAACAEALVPYFFKQWIGPERKAPKVSLPEINGRRWAQIPFAPETFNA